MFVLFLAMKVDDDLGFDDGLSMLLACVLVLVCVCVCILYLFVLWCNKNTVFAFVYYILYLVVFVIYEIWSILFFFSKVMLLCVIYSPACA